MTRRSQQQKEIERERNNLQGRIQQLQKQEEAGSQMFAALSEIENILTRMLELKKLGLEDSPEFKQLKQRYDILKGLSGSAVTFSTGIIYWCRYSQLPTKRDDHPVAGSRELDSQTVQNLDIGKDSMNVII